MVNFLEMEQGQVFYDVCELYWKDRLIFQEVLSNGLIKAEHVGVSSIIQKGMITYLNPSDAEHCFISSREANEYQNECAARITSVQSYENLKQVDDMLEEEVYSRYKKVNYKR